MTVTALGEFTVGAAIPGVLGALVAASTDLEARIASLSASIGVELTPPSLTADIALVTQMLAGLKLNFSLGVEPPSIQVQFDLMASLLLVLKLQLDIIFQLFALFGTAGLHVYHYTGTVADMGGELTAELAGGLPGGAGLDVCNALVLVATASATWAAMSRVFKVTP